jgi:anti-sigma factor RsiW
MDCRDARELLHAYADNELDAMTSRQLESHFRQCPECEQAFAADRAVKTVMANPALLRPAPESLKHQLRPNTPSHRIPWNMLGIAAAVFIAIGLGLFVPGVLSRSSANNRDADEALASHLRSLQTENHQMDVQSTDQHTVKPWFAGRLDFSPPVHDLADHGFPLVGGRLDFLHNRPVAALIYHRNKHIINLFIWPGETGQSVSEKQGYNLLHWSANGMTFWAVSDLNTAELGQFEHLFESGE